MIGERLTGMSGREGGEHQHDPSIISSTIKKEIMASREPKWWRITAGENGSLAVDWHEQDIVTVGWADTVGDFREQSAEEIVEKDDEAGAEGQVARFLGMTKDGDGMREGDTVIVYAPKPKGIVLGVGEVGEPEYVEDPDLPYDYHRYHRSVTWYDWGPVRLNDLPSDCPQPYTPKTLVKFHGSREDLESGIKSASKIPTEDIESVLSLGSDENDMHLWVMRNLQKLDEDISVTEHERSLPVGKMDILAEDSDGWVVIEIKKSEAGDDPVGQLKGYMNDLRRETDRNVRGILIAEEFTERAKRMKDENDMELYQLKLNPSFEPIG